MLFWRRISGRVAEYIVAVDVSPARFPADACKWIVVCPKGVVARKAVAREVFLRTVKLRPTHDRERSATPRLPNTKAVWRHS